MSSNNLEIYSRQDVADHYAAMEYLTPCEKSLFDEFIKPGAAVLDLGVGGGRTTSYLSSRASHYVGIDYSVEMVRRCQQKFPDRKFVVADASDLKFLESASFDAVVFAFNGMDYVIPDEARYRCLEECRRALKPGGVLLLSSHNPRAIFVRPQWNRDQLRRFSNAIGGSSGMVSGATFFLINTTAAAHALFRAAWSSTGRIGKRLPTSAFWKGEGYLLDSVHGGLLTHYSVPESVRAEVQKHQFRLLKILANDYPSEPSKYVTDWFYYAFIKAVREDLTAPTTMRY
jgi:SAM-dependent methyltransferase